MFIVIDSGNIHTFKHEHTMLDYIESSEWMLSVNVAAACMFARSRALEYNVHHEALKVLLSALESKPTKIHVVPSISQKLLHLSEFFYARDRAKEECVDLLTIKTEINHV